MWTATLVRASKNHGRLDFEIEYLDDSDGEVTNLSYSLSNATKKKVRDLARSEVKRLDDLKNEVIDLPVGQSIDIDPDVPPPPTPPTQAQIDRAAWFDDYRQLQSILTVTAALPGLLTPGRQTIIDNLIASLEADWLNSYLDGI